MKPLRTAIIGCGGWGRRHAEYLSALDDIILVGFSCRSVQSAISFNEEFTQGKGKVFTDAVQMFDELELDLAYICLPPFAHGREVEAACRHGVNLLIEKPIALDMDLALEMEKQVRTSGIKCQVGFMYRFGKAALWLKQQMQSTRPGAPAFMIGRYACNSLHSWWWRDKTKSGGQLVEQVIHILDLARFFLGEPVRVYSMQANLFHENIADYTVEDASVTAIRFASGSLASISATNGAIPGRWDYDWRLFTPELTADFSDANHALIHHTSQVDLPPTAIAADDDLYLAETLDLIDAIRTHREPAVPIEEGVRSLQLALAADRSALQGTPISLELPMG